MLAAATFHKSGHSDVAEIDQAFELLSPLLGLGIASTLFAVALLASGLNSTVTATLAGQIVMQGFLDLKLPDWLQRLVTRGIAIIPVIVVAALYGESGTAQLLVFSQVVQDGRVRDLDAGCGGGMDRRRADRDPEREAALRYAARDLAEG